MNELDLSRKFDEAAGLVAEDIKNIVSLLKYNSKAEWRAVIPNAAKKASTWDATNVGEHGLHIITSSSKKVGFFTI